MRAILFNLLSVLVITSTANGENWPQFRGPRGDGTSAEKGVPEKWGPKDGIAWKVKLPGPGASSPIVWENRIFLTCFTGKKSKELVRHVLCFDRAKGDLLWKKDYPAPLPENDYESYVLQHGFATSTPITDGERLYVVFGRDGIRCLDFSGKELWHEMAGKAINSFGSGASPFLYGDKLIVNATVEFGAMVALDKQTGKRLWKAPINGDCWSTPRIVELPAGKKELILNGSGAVYGFDPETGKELWYVDSVSGHISTTPLIRDGLIYVMNSSLSGKNVMAIRPGGSGIVTKTHVVWKQPKAGASHTSPLLLKDRLVYFSGQAMGISLKDGSIVQQERLEGIKNAYSSPILVGDRIVLFTREGDGYILDAQKLSVLNQNELGDSSGINASPALSHGRLFIRSNEFLYCIGK